MHPCPCCGYKTLPSRADYDLCPVCWWEDEGVEPWEYSGPNARTLIEAQQEFLADTRPYRLRPGKVRAPKQGEERDPEWKPFELTGEVMARVHAAKEESDRAWAEEENQSAEEIERDPEGPFKEYNSRMRELADEAAFLSHAEVRARLAELSATHGLRFPTGHLELMARLIQDENFYRQHPLHALWWLARNSTPRTFRRRWSELHSGTVRVSG